MESLFELVRWTHIVAGGVALCTFWLPWVVKKGGPAHRRAGWIYVGAMALVAVSAFVACAFRLTDAQPDNDGPAIFLAYVGLIATVNTSAGIRVIRTRTRKTGHRHPWDLGIAVLQLVGGAALLAYALNTGAVLFGAFSVLGLVTSAQQLHFWWRPPQSRMAWLFEHVGNMGGACIATVTAFTVVNARVFGLGGYSLVLWIAPGVLGGIAITLWQRHLRRKYAPGAPGANVPLPATPPQTAR